MAGSEATWQAVQAGVPVILHEMRPEVGTFAHQTSNLAELVCSNSFRSDDSEANAVGLLHWEMRAAGSLIMEMADKHKLPAGGALAVGVGDQLMMMQYSIYSVISPEGCASILWKSAEKAEDAAEAMRVSSADLKRLKLVDEVIEEPLGGAHRDPEALMANLKDRLVAQMTRLKHMDTDDLLEARYQRWMKFGDYKSAD